MTSPSSPSVNRRYPFAFVGRYRAPALLFGVTPRTAYVDLGPEGLHVRFGLWRLDTPVANISEARRTGGFGWLKTAGPPHLSFADRGVTFATNGDDAVCLSFHERVRGIDPTGRILHPGATLTVDDVDGVLTHLAHLRD